MSSIVCFKQIHIQIRWDQIKTSATDFQPSGKQQKKKTSNNNEIKRLHSSEFNMIVPYDNESYEGHYGALECLKSQLFLVRKLFEVCAR